MDLRPYQQDSIARLRGAIARGQRRILLQAPTGAGKTVISAEVARLAVEKNQSVLLLAHRRELIYQAKDKLERFGIPVGIVMSGEMRDYDAKVQVASVQTLWARAFRRIAMDLPDVDLLIIDEAHLSAANTYRKIIEAYPEAILLGMTATPIRSDGRGLGDIYEAMVRTLSVRELTEKGFLVPVRYFAPTVPDLQGLKITAGDYNQKHLENRMDDVKLIGDVVENWARIARERPTVVFASGVKHSVHLREAFRAARIPAEHIDGTTPKSERDMIVDRLAGGEVHVITNCAVLQEGWDCPRVSCAVLARPTKSLGLYLQMAGRILRPAPGKTDALIVDHSGAVYEHGRVEEYEDWTLETGKGMAERPQEIRKKAKRDLTCQKCRRIYWGSRICPHCGEEQKFFGKGVEYRDGYLYEVGVGSTVSRETKREWFSQLLGYAREMRFQDGWAAHQYHDRFGVWPRGFLPVTATEPAEEVLAFIHKQKEKYRKEVRNGIQGQGFRPSEAMESVEWRDDSIDDTDGFFTGGVL